MPRNGGDPLPGACPPTGSNREVLRPADELMLLHGAYSSAAAENVYLCPISCRYAQVCPGIVKRLVADNADNGGDSDEKPPECQMPILSVPWLMLGWAGMGFLGGEGSALREENMAPDVRPKEGEGEDLSTVVHLRTYDSARCRGPYRSFHTSSSDVCYLPSRQQLPSAH